MRMTFDEYVDKHYLFNNNDDPPKESIWTEEDFNDMMCEITSDPDDEIIQTMKNKGYKI